MEGGRFAAREGSCRAAGTTRFLRLIVDFFMATGRCAPCSLWYKPFFLLSQVHEKKPNQTNSPDLPQALQIGWPSSSLLQRGVTVVPQFWQAITRAGSPTGEPLPGPDVSLAASCSSISMSNVEVLGLVRAGEDALIFPFVNFATRLLNAGQPSQPSAPPAPLHMPPPGQLPDECSGRTYGALSCKDCGVSSDWEGETLVLW